MPLSLTVVVVPIPIVVPIPTSSCIKGLWLKVQMVIDWQGFTHIVQLALLEGRGAGTLLHVCRPGEKSPGYKSAMMNIYPVNLLVEQ